MKISILGCGWLGLPLAGSLIKMNHSIRGSVTQQEKFSALKERDIEPFLITVDESGIRCDDCLEFWESELLFLNIPPGRKHGDVLGRHPKEIRAVLDRAKEGSVKWIIFASSTSVYSNSAGKVEEDDVRYDHASSESGQALILAENMLKEESEMDCTIVRFGGLYGYDRQPGRYLAGRKNITGGDKPVNLIHRDDAIQIVIRIIDQQLKNTTLNAVSDGHPSRYDYYKAAARDLGLTIPHFDESQTAGDKWVLNRRLKEELNYEFIHPDPLAPSP